MNPSPAEGRVGEIARRIEEWLEQSHRAAASLRRALEQTRRDAEPSPEADAPPPARAGRAMADAARLARAVAAQADQVSILDALMHAASSHASRILLFVVRPDTVTGWSSRGFPADFAPKRTSLPVAADNLLHVAIARSGMVRESVSSRKGNAELAERLGGEPPREMIAAPIWVRDRVAAILYADGGGQGAPLDADTIGVMTALAGQALESIPWRQKHPRAVPAEPDPVAPRDEVGSREDDPAAPPAAVSAAPEPTAVMTPARDAEPPAGPPAETSPAPEAARAAPPATTEAAPPDPEQSRQHEEARRFARLLVSEIVLYNGDALEEGRRCKEIYQRLKDEIDRSRQMYEQRVAPTVLDRSDYFRQELIRVLARGDESAIALPWG